MTLPDAMTAVEITEPGGPDVLKPVTRPVPVPRPGQILIKVAYAGDHVILLLSQPGNITRKL